MVDSRYTNHHHGTNYQGKGRGLVEGTTLRRNKQTSNSTRKRGEEVSGGGGGSAHII